MPAVLDRVPEFDRLQQSIDALRAGTAQYTSTSPDAPGAMFAEPRTVLPVMNKRMRVTLSANQTMADSAISLVNFDTVSDDPSNSFSSVTHKFTVPVGAGGRWTIAATLNVGIPSSPNGFQNWQALVFVNGVQTLTGSPNNWLQSSVGNAFTAGATVADDDLPLNEGDVVDIRFYPNCGASSTVTRSTSTSQTVWSMHLLSR